MKQTAISAVRFLAVDAINKSKSGHPGVCLGAAPMLTELYAEHMKVWRANPNWINRDRFILSAGHGAPMLYALLHLANFGLSLDDLKNLRQLGSRTPGHPEKDVTPGIDASTGPLGQGVAMGVGMAMAERFLSARFNKKDLPLIDHYTYVLCGDGDLQEGVAQEALSLAGHYALSKLILLYDSNDVQLDGPTSASYTENIRGKYEAMGFEYMLVKDGNDTSAISKAIISAQKSSKPTLIEVKTVIGCGSVYAGKCDCHGAPIGEENTALMRKQQGWNYEPFEVPAQAYDYFNETLNKRGAAEYAEWERLLAQYRKEYPADAAEFDKALKNEFDLSFDLSFEEGHKDATRNTIGQVIKEFSQRNPTFWGGSADLTKSTKAKGADGDFTVDNPLGRNICFGVREHAMGAIVNGINLHGLSRAFTGGFFVFSDYMKPAIRLAALMEIPSVFIFTHDSIAVGEDGPTHQPIEQFAGLRAMPNLNVFRPCDAYEVVECFKQAMLSAHTPSVIVLTRQNLVTERHEASDVSKGAYVLKREHGKLDLCLLATGSEVNLAMRAAEKLEAEGKGVRVVSMPNMYAFDKQPVSYVNGVLPAREHVVAVEMASGAEFYKYASRVYGIEKFGASAPADLLLKEYGFDVDSLINFIKG